MDSGRRPTWVPGSCTAGPCWWRGVVLGQMALGLLCGCQRDVHTTPPLTRPAADTATVAPEDSSSDETGEPTTRYTNRSSSVWTEDSARVSRQAAPLTTLRAVRTASHPDFDRIVFDFGRGHVPGYDVRYAGGPEPPCDPEGALPRQGDAVLRITLEPARAHTGAGVSSLDARVLHPGQAELRTLAIECDLGARLTWIADLTVRRPFRVFELRSPARLIVDILH